VSVGRKTALLFFRALALALGKNKCAVLALAFLVQMLMICTIFRIMHNVLGYKK
jgi:hypothetical protein